MKLKTIYALIIGSLLATASVNTFAAETNAPPSKEDETVVGACMVQKLQEKSIKQSVIDKCADADAKSTSKCLGISDDDYSNIIKFCISQLTNAKCVADKMKVPLIKYADCGYEQDPAACYKGLGFTIDQIVKLSTDCDKAGTNS